MTYAEDAVLWGGDYEVKGRNNIVQVFASDPANHEDELFIEEIEGRRDLAFVSGYWTELIDSDERIVGGHYLDVVSKQPDGTWLFYRNKVTSKTN